MEIRTEKESSKHFTEIARLYDKFRDTDAEVVDFIADAIGQVGGSLSLDLATGTARYPIAVARKYGHGFVCVDINENMLAAAREECAHTNGLIKFVHADCCDLNGVVGAEKTYGVVSIMNALNYIPDIPALTRSVAGAIAEEGSFLVYTRMDDQNDRTIWGQHFPGFSERETSFLGHSGFPTPELKDLISQGGMEVVDIQAFELARDNTLPELTRKVDARYYTTFDRYSPSDLELAKTGFIENIHTAFPETRTDPNYRINHVSPMSMVIAKRAE